MLKLLLTLEDNLTDFDYNLAILERIIIPELVLRLTNNTFNNLSSFIFNKLINRIYILSRNLYNTKSYA